MEKALISVVVLTHPGREKDVFRCLDSVENSSYQNVEIVLVSNGVNPLFRKTIETKFVRPRIIWLNANAGCLGFNLGYANARGEYILSLDDDTAIEPDTIEKIMKAVPEKPREVGIISLNVCNPETKRYYQSPTSRLVSFQAGGAVFKRELFDRIGYYDESFFLWGEEDDFLLRTLDAGYKVDFEKNIAIYHYEKTGGIRKERIFFNARNKAWLNIKHFSAWLVPFLVARDLIWIIFLPYRKRSLRAFVYGLIGYLYGYLSFAAPLRKRGVVSDEVQKMFLEHYLFGDLR